MRVWLALVVAVIVSVTAVAVAEILTVRSESAFRARAEDLAAGSAVTAAALVSSETTPEGARAAAASAATRRRIALFLFDKDGRRISGKSSNGVDVESVTGIDETVRSALAGRRLVQSTDGGRRIIVALRLRTGSAGALVAVASRPDLVAAGDIVRGQLGLTVLIAIVGGAALGTALALLITSRVRRVTTAARAIEQGNFDNPLTLRFNDEIGQLGSAVDGMRLHLRNSFATLEAERDRFRSFLEQLQEGVVAVDRDLRVVFANSRARLQIGRRALAPGEPLPEPWPDLSLRDLATPLFKAGAGRTSERVHTVSGETFSVAGVPAGIPGQAALLVITEVTAADRRERAEREFVANAAHELRTPIAAIVSAMEVLQGGAKAEPDARDRFLAVISRQSDRLERLIRALLTLARAQTRAEQIELEAVDIASLLEETASVFRVRGGATIEVDCPPGLTAWSHYDLLYQAVGNLAENAVKHANGNPVRLSAATAGEGRVRIEVRDRGPGIPYGDRERLFDRFYRGGSRTAEGFGLGLSIVGGVVAVLGGEVEIEPAEGGGTSASIVFGSRSAV
ncbi:Signal transduction histidine kinase [Gaiella occulta]|uniref:Sensor-like histidine kinase SenX3 n=1 Tax=Gaiella occulta TaxID=1002870 RepID=A0A7M2YWY9_9ACTN|nr:ATP-binding protein [Gaiella occulta]RDI73997.1 Signal transduction histidine kinase [Gaiella occulta]